MVSRLRIRTPISNWWCERLRRRCDQWWRYKPSNVPATSEIMVIAEEQGEHSVQSFLFDTEPTDTEALFTTDGGSEYKLKFNNYPRLAGFNADGSAKIDGNAAVMMVTMQRPTKMQKPYLLVR